MIFSISFLLKRAAPNRKSYYDAGIKSLKQGNCDRAKEQFSSLETYGTFLNKVDKLPDAVKHYQQECKAWQSTEKEVDGAKENQDFAQVLVSYDNFVELHSQSALVKFAREKTQTLFNELEIKQLASDKSCKQIDSLVKHELIPDRDLNLPLLYLGCIEIYREKQDIKKELDFQTEFLVDFPQHDRALSIKQGLIQNPLVCDRSEELQKNEAVPNWGNLMSVVYLSCGKAYQEVKNYKRASAFYQSVAINYPEDELVSQADSYLASIDREINAISQEMSIAADVIKGRITVCTAGSIFLDWLIDLGEVFSGKDCMTGESLHDIERWLTIVPLIDGLKGASKLARLWQIIDTVTTFTEIQHTQNLLQDRQSLLNFLDNETEMELLKAHNFNLVPLVANTGNAIDLSQQYSEVAQLLQ